MKRIVFLGLIVLSLMACSNSIVGSDVTVQEVQAKGVKPYLTVSANDAQAYYDLSWTAVSGAVSYQLYVTEKYINMTVAKPMYTTVYGTSQRWYHVRVPGDYSFKVRAKYSNGSYSSWSSLITKWYQP